jgi:antitoxin component of MazEF toxin-antitoxin module
MYYGITGCYMKEERERLTNPERIEAKKTGGSEVVRIPASWIKTIPQLKGHLVFDMHVERDKNGKIYIVSERVKT